MEQNTLFMLRLAVAALIGLATGLEREWSGHATGPKARFAGIRTFLLLGLLGGCAGLLLSRDQTAAAVTVIAGGALFTVVAYAMAVRTPDAELDGTTEAAALLVIALGALAGIGMIELAAAAGSVAVLALSEKTRLQWFVQRVGAPELRAALQFAVLALVLLPVLPSGPLWGAAAVRPRMLWALVLMLSALNYAGYLARRLIGTDRGYRVTGMLGGLVSSTAITLEYARESRRERSAGAPLAYGVVGACAVVIPRVLVVSLVLDATVAKALVVMLLPSLVLGAAIVTYIWTRPLADTPADDDDPRSPLQLWNAIRMAIVFQVAMSAFSFIQTAAGTKGVFAGAALLGTTDVDAVTVSMSRSAAETGARVAAQAITIGVAANTVVKLCIAAFTGTAQFRRVAVTGLFALLAAAALGLFAG